MMSLEFIRTLASAVQGNATKAAVMAETRRKRIAEIEGDPSRSRAWKDQYLGPIKSSPELRAILSIGMNAMAQLKEAMPDWRTPGRVLAQIGKPSTGAGLDLQTRWNSCLAEAQMIARNPKALKQAAQDAAAVRDWAMLQALCLAGGADGWGRPVFPLEAAELPGVEEAESLFEAAELGGVRLSRILLELDSDNASPGPWVKIQPDGSWTNLTLDSAELQIKKAYSDAKTTRARRYKTPTTDLEASEPGV